MRRIGYKARVLIVNDALVALEAGAPGHPGVVIISGTGSIAYGRNASERSRARRRLGLRARRRGQRLLDRPGRVARGAARGRSARPADRADAAAAEALRRRAGAGSAPRGLLQQPAAVRDRCARAVRRGGVPAKATARRSASFARRRTSSKRLACRVARRLGLMGEAVHVRPLRRDLPRRAVAARGARAPACRWPRPAAARSCSPASRPPAPSRSRSRKPRGGARFLPTNETDDRHRSDARLHVYPDERAAARALARQVADAIRVKPDLVLGLPTGTHARRALPRARARWRERGRSTFRGSRRSTSTSSWGFRRRIPGSYRRFMDDAPVRPRATSPAAQINFLDGDGAGSRSRVRALRAGDRARPAASTCRSSASARTGTSASTSRRRRCRRARIASSCGRRPGAAMPRCSAATRARCRAEALSMGMATILQARSIVLLATGAERRACVERLLEWTDHDGAAGIVPPAAPGRRHRGRCRGGRRVWRRVRAEARSTTEGRPRRRTLRQQLVVQARGALSTSSPIASRTESSAFFRRRSAFGSVRPGLLHHDCRLDVQLARA